MKYFRMALMVLMLCGSAGAQEVVYRAALAEVATPAWQEFHDSLRPMLEEAGYEVTDFDFDALCDSEQLDISKVDLLVLPDASTLPAPSTKVIHDYLKQGGDIAAFNTPMWRTALVSDEGKWIRREAYQARHKDALLEQVIFDFDTIDLSQWQRTSDDMSTKTTHTVEAVSGESFDSALRVDIDDLTAWDTFVSPEMETIFPADHSLTVFWAKGSEQTDALLLEWVERDGSRWMATIKLSDQWQQYVLEPKDFKFWESAPARRGATFNPANAQKFAVGLAHSHLQLRGKEHRYWLSDFGTARRTPVHDTLLTAVDVPELETLSPEWKFFECTDVKEMYIKYVTNNVTLPEQHTIFSSHPRPGHTGFNKGRDWIWKPILNVAADYGSWRGNPATRIVYVNEPYSCGVWTSFSISDPNWYTKDSTTTFAIQQALSKIRDGLFIVDGGTDYYDYFYDQPVIFGVHVYSTRKSSTETGVWFWPNKEDELYNARRTTFELIPNHIKRITSEPFYQLGSSNLMGVFFQESSKSDPNFVEMEFTKFSKEYTPSFVTVENGDFMLDGQRWRPHGVNYMPSSGVGLNRSQQAQFEYWLSKESYDPEIIQRDLYHLNGMGINSLSIFLYHNSVDSMNLNDLLLRMARLGMKANLSLRPGTPMNFRWEEIKEMIVKNRLAENDTVYLYDLAWEPMHHDHKARVEWDGEWREWIVERYGSIENAEKDWGVAAPRDDAGKVTNPLDDQMLKDGDHRIMVAAYRRFLDTLLYKYYSRARRLVKSVDPNHLVSFRMTLAGDPTVNWGHVTPYHYDYLAGAVDVLEPEAYGRIGDWEKVKPGWFTYEYGRWANPKLPIIWAEAGVSAWSRATMSSTQTGLDFQATFFTDMYKMMMDSGADGIYWWWYPGGYRTNENSDYGIINPDGSDRPVTKVIREHGKTFSEIPSAKPVDHWITMDRDRHVNGIVGIYEEVQEEFWQAIADGKTPGLRTEGTGTTSQNCPLLAVGNTPWNGSNPLKYLDGFFDVVEVLNAKGIWQTVENGGEVVIDPAKPVQARITVTNLGEATWVSKHPMNPRLVTIAIKPTIKGFFLPNDLERFESVILEGEILPANLEKTTTITLQCQLSGSVKESGGFGPLFDITLTP